jgi:hypothetical protein
MAPRVGIPALEFHQDPKPNRRGIADQSTRITSSLAPEILGGWMLTDYGGEMVKMGLMASFGRCTRVSIRTSALE